MKKILFTTTCLLLTMSCSNSYAAAAASAKGATEEIEISPAKAAVGPRLTLFRDLAEEKDIPPHVIEGVSEYYLKAVDDCLAGMSKKRQDVVWGCILQDLQENPDAVKYFAAQNFFTTYDSEMTDDEFNARVRSTLLINEFTSSVNATALYKINPIYVFTGLFNNSEKSVKDKEEMIAFFVKEVAPRMGHYFCHVFGHLEPAQEQVAKYYRLGREAYLAQM